MQQRSITISAQLGKEFLDRLAVDKFCVHIRTSEIIGRDVTPQSPLTYEEFAAICDNELTTAQIESAVERHGHDRTAEKTSITFYAIYDPYTWVKKHQVLTFCTKRRCSNEKK